jgi:hypothetical protein
MYYNEGKCIVSIWVEVLSIQSPDVFLYEAMLPDIMVMHLDRLFDYPSLASCCCAYKDIKVSP